MYSKRVCVTSRRCGRSSARIENFYWGQHDWSLKDWRERFVSHLLLSGFTRALIWQLQAVDPTPALPSFDNPSITHPSVDGLSNNDVPNESMLVMWREDRFEGVDGRPVEGLTDTTRVQLWHPVGTAVETVLAWSGRLETPGIIQPFKQAYREAYLLTDAERDTNFTPIVLPRISSSSFPFIASAKNWAGKTIFVSSMALRTSALSVHSPHGICRRSSGSNP